jgi:hypothetical protein
MNEENSVIKKPIFIIGSGRSGTTMLGEILTKANVGKSFEGHFVVKAFQMFGDQKLSALQVKQLVEQINSYQSSKFFKLNLTEDNYNADDGVTTKKIVSDALEFVADSHVSKQWIEKTPNYIYNLSLILEHFPDAQIIWMLRDGRDVAYSVFQKSWGANNIYYAAIAWLHANSPSPSLNDSRVLLVKYEDFLSEPHKSLLDIFNFLNFECTDIEYLTSKINPQRMNRWKQTLTRKQIKTFEAVAFDCLKIYGYETQSGFSPQISSIEKALYKLHHFFKLGLHLVNENIFKAITIKLKMTKPFNEKN